VVRGTGETLAARFLHELASRRTLVLVPSLSLLKQTSATPLVGAGQPIVG